ncbi:MAG: GNAT family N-acetyltransferase [Flavobacteriales bacterium]|nr:GNAT family N-acetyltransferase [Flavobacteriales bacterium]
MSSALFHLRPFRMEDLPALVKHASDPTVAANLTDSFPNPFTEEAGHTFLEAAMKTPPLRRCIEVGGECCGALGLHPKQDLWRRNMELGYWLATVHRGQGIMTEAIKRMVELGFETYPEVTRIFATPFGSNTASQRALEKAGFTLEAKLIGTLVKNGVVQDEWIYGVRR